MRSLVLAFALFFAFAADTAAEPIHLAVDLSDAPRHLIHSRETIPVAPGVLALRYAKWIPGEHSPAGPIVDLAGIRVSAGKQALAWERDSVDMHLFRVTVPPGVQRIEVALDYLAPGGGGNFTDAPASSPKVAVLAWNTVLLYPDHARARRTSRSSPRSSSLMAGRRRPRCASPRSAGAA